MWKKPKVSRFTREINFIDNLEVWWKMMNQKHSNIKWSMLVRLLAKIYKEWKPTVVILKMISIRDISRIPNQFQILSCQNRIRQMFFKNYNLMTLIILILSIHMKIILKLYHQASSWKTIQMQRVTIMTEWALILINLNHFRPNILKSLSKTTPHASLESKQNVFISENSKDKNKSKMNKCKRNLMNNSRKLNKPYSWKKKETRVQRIESKVNLSLKFQLKKELR